MSRDHQNGQVLGQDARRESGPVKHEGTRGVGGLRVEIHCRSRAGNRSPRVVPTEVADRAILSRDR